jgi:2,3-bisphosphoglycerate-independent phosphoglycerate mutase
MKNKVGLIILDGWGIGKGDSSDAVAQANTPYTDNLSKQFPHAELRTDGENVGLPEGQMGNSEVGHTNIGAGRVVYQDLVRINRAIREKTFFDEPALLAAIDHAKSNNCPLHVMGLLSNGGVHSHIDHVLALIGLADLHDVQVFVHAILDGRDTDPQSGKVFMQTLLKALENSNAKLATIIGRYYAMDRDKRWERVKKAFDLYVHKIGAEIVEPIAAIEMAYKNGTTDEFMEPMVVNSSHGFKGIQDNDAMICFNFRTDRCREITEVLTQRAMPEFNMKPLNLHYVTMTNYDSSYSNVHVVYDKDNLDKTLGQCIAESGAKQVRIAETEKYPHVTFFFNGGREEPFEGEDRIMVPSPKVATYDLMPEMSAQGIATAIIERMTIQPPDFFCLNFANPDMVGHTGVFDAIVKAVETTDNCLQQVVTHGLGLGYSFVVIADHGNADFAINDDGSPNTAHTINPVPIWLISPSSLAIKSGILADIAPTILQLMGIKKPDQMTGQSLLLD